MNPLVTISILSYNRLEDLKRTFKHLEFIDYDNIEIIVWDNNSTDGSDIFIQKHKFKRKFTYHYTLSDTNVGIAVARRSVFNMAKGRYVLSIDDDSFPDPDSIKKAVKWFETNNKLGAIACNIVPIEYKIKNKDYTVKTIYKSYDLFTGSGAFIRKYTEHFNFTCLYGSSIYKDEFKYCKEDTSTGLEILNVGYNIKSIPDIVIRHAYSPLNRTYNHKMEEFAMGYINLFKMYSPYYKRFLIGYIFDAVKYGIKHKTFKYLKALKCIFRPKSDARIKPLSKCIWNKILLPYKDLFSYWKIPDVKYKLPTLNDNIVIIKTVGTIPMFNLIQTLKDYKITVLTHKRNIDFFKSEVNVLTYMVNKPFKSLKHVRYLTSFNDNPTIIIPIVSNDISTVDNVTKMCYDGGITNIEYYDISEGGYIDI